MNISLEALLGIAVGLVIGLWQILLQLLTVVESRRQRALQRSKNFNSYDFSIVSRSMKNYIRPSGSNMDPCANDEIAFSIGATSSDMFRVLDRFIDGDAKIKHMLILGDSGMGKTSLLLKYLAENESLAKRRQKLLAVVPLGHPNADSLITSVERKNETTIFLDAFDEDQLAIRNHRKRLDDLLAMTRDFRKIVITCRTQFFPTDSQIPEETGIVSFYPCPAGSNNRYEFFRIYLMPMSMEDVSNYLKRFFGLWRIGNRRRALAIAKTVPYLSVRPMLMAHLPDLIECEPVPMRLTDIYEAMMTSWISREEGWIDPCILRDVSDCLAIEMLTKSGQKGGEYLRHDELSEVVSRYGINIEDWKVRSRSLLNRTSNGDYKFAHRSFMEFISAKVLYEGFFVAEELCLSDGTVRFFCERLTNDENLTSMMSKAFNKQPISFRSIADNSWSNLSDVERVAVLSTVIAKLVRSMHSKWTDFPVMSGESAYSSSSGNRWNIAVSREMLSIYKSYGKYQVFDHAETLVNLSTNDSNLWTRQKITIDSRTLNKNYLLSVRSFLRCGLWFYRKADNDSRLVISYAKCEQSIEIDAVEAACGMLITILDNQQGMGPEYPFRNSTSSQSFATTAAQPRCIDFGI